MKETPSIYSLQNTFWLGYHSCLYITILGGKKFCKKNRTDFFPVNKIAIQVDYGRPRIQGCQGHNSPFFFFNVDHDHSISVCYCDRPATMLLKLNYLI